MELTKRLAAIAEYVHQGSIVADVGTDHGYIPIDLVKRGISPRAYAMDIGKGPLAKAEKNIALNDVKGLVEPILSDGIKALGERKVDTLIIAGMGGMLIKKILMEEQEKLVEIPNLILSPHLDVDQVRRTVHILGYSITAEDFIEEEQKFYPILVCCRGNELYTDLEYLYGKQYVPSCILTYKKYLEICKNQNRKLLDILLNKRTPSSLKRAEELKKIIEDIQEVEKWF